MREGYLGDGGEETIALRVTHRSLRVQAGEPGGGREGSGGVRWRGEGGEGGWGRKGGRKKVSPGGYGEGGGVGRVWVGG